MGGGTEAFPDLGMHCQNPDCNQLDFLPFKCDGCFKVFCTEHRSYKSHECPNSDHNSRRVVVCEKCSTSIEITRNIRGEVEFGGDEESVLAKHEKSGDCDPKKKKKPTCAVRRCKEILTFSNMSTCKSCDLKVCLRHRFPADHACKNSHQSPAVGLPGGSVGGKFLAALASRNGQDCTKKERGSVSKPNNSSSLSVKAY